MRGRRRELRLLVGAAALAAVLLVLVSGALSASGTHPWQWEVAATPDASRDLIATTSASGPITLGARFEQSGLATLVVSANGREVQRAAATSLPDDQPLAAFVVGDGAGGEAIIGVARSDVAHLLLRSDGAIARELPLNSAGAFAASDATPGHNAQLEALAADGSTIGRIDLPTTAATCSALASCTSAQGPPNLAPASPLVTVASLKVLGNTWRLQTYTNSAGTSCLQLKMGRGGTSRGCPVNTGAPAYHPAWGAAGHSAASGRAGWGRVWVFGQAPPSAVRVTLVRECAIEQVEFGRSGPHRGWYLLVLTPAELRAGGLPRELIVRDAAGTVLQDTHISMGTPQGKLPPGQRSCGSRVTQASSTVGVLGSSASLYAVLESQSKGVIRDDLTRLDPATLNPVGPGLRLGARRLAPGVGAMALSPDQKRLAVAASRGGGIQIVDLGSLRVARRITARAGIDVRSLAWLDNDQLAVIGQQMSKPYARNVVGRWLIRVKVGRGSVMAMSLPKKAMLQYSQRAGSRLISVLAPNNFNDPHRTVIAADADGRTLIVPIALPAPSPKMFEDRPVASADGTHLYIVRGGGQILDLDIAAGKTEVHQVAAPSDAPGTVPQSSMVLAEAAEDGLVVSGVFTFTRGGERAFRSGVYRIDTSSWSATTLDRGSSSFVVYGDQVATFKRAPVQRLAPAPKTARIGQGTGVTVYSAATGRRAYHVFGKQLFSFVRMIDGYGHALQPRSGSGLPYGVVDTHFNAKTGAATGQSQPPLNGLRLIYRGSPDIHEPGSAAPASATRKSQRLAGAGKEPRAFARPRRATDALPRAIHVPDPARSGAMEKIIATRRIATYTDGRGRRALLYLVKTPHQICDFIFWGSGAGGGCNSSTNFFTGGHVAVGSGHLLSGVADDDVASLVVVGSRGVRHPVAVTADGGFIYDCKAYNGCTCVVDHVEAFDAAGAKIESDHVGGRCRKTQSASHATTRGYTISNRGRAVPSRGNRNLFLGHGYQLFLLGSAGGRAFYRIQLTPHYTCWGSGPSQTIGKVGTSACPALVGAYPLQLHDTVVELRRGARIPRYIRVAGLVVDQAASVALQDPTGATVKSVQVENNLFSIPPPYPHTFLRVVALDAQGKPLPPHPEWGEHQTPPANLFGPRTAKVDPASIGPVVQRGEAKGVTVAADQDGVVVFDARSIDARARRALGGRIAWFACFQISGQNVRQNRSAGISTPLAPVVAFEIKGIKPRYDGCEAGGSYGHRWHDRYGPHSTLEIPLTAQGTRYFEDRATARDLAAFVRSAKTQAIRRKTGAALKSAIRTAYGPEIRFLTSSSASAPPGQVGVWSRGSRTIFKERSHLGDRFYVQFDDGKLTHENVRGLAFVF
jgi:hypothetical protein